MLVFLCLLLEFFEAFVASNNGMMMFIMSSGLVSTQSLLKGGEKRLNNEPQVVYVQVPRHDTSLSNVGIRTLSMEVTA